MRSIAKSISLTTLLALAASQSVSAAMLWDESTNGDLSSSGLEPTLLMLNSGSNEIVGSGGTPLQAGTYSVWVQDTGGPATYGFDFGVTSSVVPLPPALLLMGSSLLALGGFFRRKLSLG
jgi:hypothetical protein